jgi:hypothetical protein
MFSRNRTEPKPKSLKPNQTETEVGLKSCEPNRAHLCFEFT